MRASYVFEQLNKVSRFITIIPWLISLSGQIPDLVEKLLIGVSKK